MPNRVAHKRYAKALYAYAKESKVEKEVYRDMLDLQKLFKEDRVLKRLVHNPTVSNSVKSNLLNALFKDRVDSVCMKFLQLLVKNNRESNVVLIVEEFLRYYRVQEDYIDVCLTLAYQADDGLIERFREKIESEYSKKVLMKVVVDKDLVGGFTLMVGERYIDRSVSGNFYQLKKRLIKKNYQIKKV